MATKVFLGEPPADIKQWIIEHSGPSTPSETYINGTPYLITGPLTYQWFADNNFIDSGGNWTNDVESIQVGSAVTYLQQYAISNCPIIKNISIPSSVLSIENEVFMYDSQLTSVSIENGLTSIGNLAFSDCTSLPNLTIPASVQYIGKWNFIDCFALTSLTFVGKTFEQVQAMENYADWGLEDTSIIHVA